MFDPTIFDNVKVVLEGAVYDEDLDGKIKVVDRKDYVNLAEMSRDYSISFKLKDDSLSTCKWLLSSNTLQLSSEILDIKEKTKLGCVTSIEFFVTVEMREAEYTSIKELISSMWKQREVIVQLKVPFPFEKYVKLQASVLFNRIILEEDIDDLIEMLQYMITTLQALENKGY